MPLFSVEFLNEAIVNHLRIDLFQRDRRQFLSLLDEREINYNDIQTFSKGSVLASGMSVMVSLVQASAPWIAFSAVLVAWIRSRASRKIIITTKDLTVVHLEGLSQSEVEVILGLAERITVIDTGKDAQNLVAGNISEVGLKRAIKAKFE